MTPYPLCSLFLTAAGRLLVGTLVLSALVGCGGQKPTPIVQSSSSSSSVKDSLSPSKTPSAVAKVGQALATNPTPNPVKLPDEQSAEALAQLSLLSLTSGQQARFAEKKEFAPAIADLDKKWKPLEKYEIAMKAEGREKVVITAKAKDGSLKSYTAVLYGFDSANTAAAVTCGTLSPSQTPPDLTAPPPQSPEERLFCPPGTYRSDGLSPPPAPKKS